MQDKVYTVSYFKNVNVNVNDKITEKRKVMFFLVDMWGKLKPNANVDMQGKVLMVVWLAVTKISFRGLV